MKQQVLRFWAHDIFQSHVDAFRLSCIQCTALPSAPGADRHHNDMSSAQVAHNYLRQDQLFHRVLHLPVALAGVSDAVQSILAQQFGRSSLLIPNGVDCDRFFPGPPSDVLPSAILSSPTKTQVRPFCTCQASCEM